MTRRLWLGGLLALTLAAAAGADEKKAPAKNAGLERMKKLAGTWVAADDKGQPTGQVVSVFKVTSAGSAVQETLFPGTDHEMVTVYHLDGPDVVLTHYCALGNQPHLKLDTAGLPNKLAFKFVGGTNLNPAKDMHMHEGTITIVDDDHLESSWQGWQDGKAAAGHAMTMKLVRKK
jgi:hypothetical protein